MRDILSYALAAMAGICFVKGLVVMTDVHTI